MGGFPQAPGAQELSLQALHGSWPALPASQPGFVRAGPSARRAHSARGHGRPGTAASSGAAAGPARAEVRERCSCNCGAAAPSSAARAGTLWRCSGESLRVDAQGCHQLPCALPAAASCQPPWAGVV